MSNLLKESESRAVRHIKRSFCFCIKARRSGITRGKARLFDGMRGALCINENNRFESLGWTGHMKIGRRSKERAKIKSKAPLMRPKTPFVFICAFCLAALTLCEVKFPISFSSFINLSFSTLLLLLMCFLSIMTSHSRSHEKKRVNFINWNANMCSWMYARIKQSIVSTALWYHTIWTSLRERERTRWGIKWSEAWRVFEIV